MPRGIPNPKPDNQIDDMGSHSPAPNVLRTTAGINNTQTNYQPSPERNNLDQALQPTGHLGAVAGMPEDVLPDDEPLGEDQKPKGKMFPVLLKKGYKPMSDDCFGVLSDGRMGSRPKFEENTLNKIKAGYKVFLPIEEAKRIISLGIAERADAIE